jgi:hypothetical protein
MKARRRSLPAAGFHHSISINNGAAHIRGGHGLRDFVMGAGAPRALRQ